jgi:hypothetical protein
MAVKLWPRRSSAEVAGLARITLEEALLALDQLAADKEIHRVGRRACSIQRRESPIWSTDPEDTPGIYHLDGIPRNTKSKRDKRRHEH